jgi:hypothetical protein
VILVEDSVVRGTTTRSKMRALARPGRRRSTCGSAARRSATRASTASTSRPGRS